MRPWDGVQPLPRQVGEAPAVLFLCRSCCRWGAVPPLSTARATRDFAECCCAAGPTVLSATRRQSAAPQAAAQCTTPGACGAADLRAGDGCPWPGTTMVVEDWQQGTISRPATRSRRRTGSPLPAGEVCEVARLRRRGTVTPRHRTAAAPHWRGCEKLCDCAAAPQRRSTAPAGCEKLRDCAAAAPHPQPPQHRTGKVLGGCAIAAAPQRLLCAPESPTAAETLSRDAAASCLAHARRCYRCCPALQSPQGLVLQGLVLLVQWCTRPARDRLALLVNREQLVPTLPGVRHGAAMQALPSKASPKPWPGKFGGVTALAVEGHFDDSATRGPLVISVIQSEPWGISSTG